jgi:Ca-activated chloride channel family protein
LYDATVDAIEAIRPVGGRRALLLLSDGDDRGSQTSGLDLVDRARLSDVLVYPIAIGRKPVPLFAELAAATGGRSGVVRDSRQAAEVAATIARELRFQYLLGYTPSVSRQTGARWRSIQVEVTRSSARVRARDGYQAR